MTTYPLTIPLTLRRSHHQPRQIDEYGNPIDTPSPVAFTDEEILVFAIVQGGTEPTTATHPERIRSDLTIYPHISSGITENDRILWNNQEYEVIEPPGNWNSSPWFQPGLVEVHCNAIQG